MSQLATEFLSQRRIAVAGVSRAPQGHGANIVYRRLKDRGYEVFAVNPKADTVEGDRCYHDLRSIPGGVNGVVIATPAGAAEDVVKECHDLGITRVWMHRSVDAGSVSPAAVDFCRRKGIDVIPGGCPLMFGPTSDTGHKCMRFILQLTGAVPRGIG